MSAFRLPFLAFADQNLSPPVKYKLYVLRLLFKIERNHSPCHRRLPDSLQKCFQELQQSLISVVLIAMHQAFSHLLHL